MSAATRQDGSKEGAPRVQNWRTRRTYRRIGTAENIASLNRSGAGLSSVGLATAWLLPWSRADYPGIYRGLISLLGKRWSRETLRRWATGKQRARPDVTLALAVEIERRCEVGLAIAAQLRIEADAWRPFDRSRLGFLAIDPATGRNRRFRG